MAQNKRTQLYIRYGIVSLIIFAMAGAILYKAVANTIIDADRWNAKADSLLERVYFVHPMRGDILADDGTVLATNLLTYNVNLDYRTSARNVKKFIASLDSLCDSLAYYYPQRNKDQWKQYLAKPLEDSVHRRKMCHVIVKDGTMDDYNRILTFPYFRDFKKKYQHGLYSTSQLKRAMPYGKMASRSIGRCSFRFAPKFEGATQRKDSVDVLHGYSGLEYALDSLLYGCAGTARVVPLTHGVSSWVDSTARHGYSLRTTIDIDMQDIVENELLSMLEKTRADWGACIMMEVATGNIKAISNLEKQKDGSGYTEAQNHVLRAYEPGSVMKPISMIVALEDGFAFPLEKTYAIGSTYAYAGGSPIHDTHSPATLPVSRFIEYSSNIGMTKLIAPHYENDLNGFRARLTELGFFDKFNTGMAGERPPYFPTLHPKAGGRVSLSRMAYGYSTQIPPLYTCAVYNAIANKGRFVRPRMVQELITRDGQVTTLPVSYVRDSICSQKNAKILLDMLYSVVYGQGGTAKSLKSETVTIAGKTGTCRIADETIRDKDGNIIHLGGGYKDNQYRLAFCGIFPYEDPKYTCMVLISNPAPEYKGAATTSGFVVKGVALKMFARGMLGDHSDFRTAEANHRPTLYACDSETEGNIKNALGIARIKKIADKTSTSPGRVPSLTGLGIRQAVALAEEEGYNVEVEGEGYAYRQIPEPGTQLPAGETIKIKFRNI